MRPKTHSFSGFGNVPSSHTWQPLMAAAPPPRIRTPPPRINEISLYSRQQAERQLERQRRQNKPYQITHISSTIRNLTHKGPAKSVDAYIFTQVPSSLASSDEPDKLSEHTQPPRETIIEIGNGYAGYHTKKKRIVATPASTSLSFIREILFRIAEFICSLRGNY
ncbi:Hypothetical predicted protein [Cloeon dipterum]|uniref:Uncharacterized protein n=1 Tax=Cloeon dipterum TaxID=197152 RepID=A0A8S1CXP2_9INSE|nr:Hypothetical predicted protein [Cloeon dipterum]